MYRVSSIRKKSCLWISCYGKKKFGVLAQVDKGKPSTTHKLLGCYFDVILSVKDGESRNSLKQNLFSQFFMKRTCFETINIFIRFSRFKNKSENNRTKEM